MAKSRSPGIDGWSFDPDFEGWGGWFHDDCPSPSVLTDGTSIGGVGFEERIRGRLVAVVCLDCDEAIAVRRRPTT